jgi:hypothetical protein
MKKVLLLLTVGMVLMSAVPNLWAGPPQIQVQVATPAPSWFSYLLGLIP